MWVLMLNDMRSSNIENLQPVFRAETKEKLKEFIEKEKVEHYTDDGTRILQHTTDMLAGTTEINNGYKWQKCFRKDGPLEWFNKPYEYDENKHFINVGTKEDWANDARQDYERKIEVIPLI